MIIQSARKIRRKFRINRWANKRRRHQIRPATLSDVPNLLKVEGQAWGETEALAFGEHELRTQILRYPDGTLLAESLSPSGVRVEAFCSSMKISEGLFTQLKDEPCTWEEVTSSGLINNHSPEGTYLYGVNLSVPPRAERMGIGNTLRAYVGAKIVKEGLLGVILESRLPKMHDANKERRLQGKPALDGPSYVELTNSRGQIFDPELRDYLETPLMKILAVKPNFFQDPQSENWGVLLMWPNPLHFFGLGFLYSLRPFSNPIIRTVSWAVGIGV